MNLLTRITELLTNAAAAKEMDCHTPEQMAFYLIYHGVNVPICNIGDKIYEVFEDDLEEHGGEAWIGSMTVTEVGMKNIIVSAFEPPEDDVGDVIPISRIGVDVFLTKKEAEKALAERSAQ